MENIKEQYDIIDLSLIMLLKGEKNWANITVTNDY